MSERQSVILATIAAITVCFVATQFRACMEHESRYWDSRAEHARAIARDGE